ncbi:MAG: SagB family peptide dehydrogenase [Bradyrhizobium sp.]|nr:SagB family peptide dehydrogenase [Bradyrhizobium sp.]
MAKGPLLAGRLNPRVALDAQADGNVVARFDGHALGLGKFSEATIRRLGELRGGLPLASVKPGRAADKELDLLLRRLAHSGLLEYRLGPARGGDDVVIEPQIADYWPQIAKIANTDTIALSRFAYLRRRGKEMVLESPRAGALFRIGDPRIAAALTTLAHPQKINRYRKERGFPGLEVLGLLLDCQILFKLKPGDAAGLRASEGDPNLVLWDFHDLLFHTRSTDGRQANPLGGLYSYADLMPPLPAVRPPWPGEVIALEGSTRPAPTPSPFASLLGSRHSIRDFDDEHPITLSELAAFLQTAARVQAKWTSGGDTGEEGPEVSYASRPYPSGGAAYELELYLAVEKCDGLARGFYHYDADRHALTAIEVGARDLDAQLLDAEFAIGASHVPQILIVIAARFGRVSWKYSSVAYSLILKDVGVLTQTLYLAAADLGLGGCAIGTNNIDRFARMTGLDFSVEGSVGQFALGRGRPERAGAERG